MLYSLMNGDREVARFDLEDVYVEVIDNNFLPRELKDYIKTTEPTVAGIKKTARDLEVLKDFLISRTLNLSRDNAKAILNVASLPQSLKAKEKLKIVFCCSGLSLADNFWLKRNGSEAKFSDVDLRKQKLSDASYEIAIFGRHVSATAEELRPDLSTSGMFPKYWSRRADGVYLCKTDMYSGNPSVDSEIECCKHLEEMGISCAHYDLEKRDGRKFAISKCLATEEVSLVHAQSVEDWCMHTGADFDEFVRANYMTDFANMCVCDYVFANTDRHFENWGFLVSNKTNEILRFAPLFDHNQALLSDYFGKGVDKLTYEPCNATFIEAVAELAPYSTADFSKAAGLSDACLERAAVVERCKNSRSKEHEDYCD